MKHQIVVFHMDGCPACKTYLPRFKIWAAKHANKIDTRAVNVSTGAGAVLGDKYKIKAAPTTLVFGEGERPLRRIEGVIDAKELDELFQRFAR